MVKTKSWGLVGIHFFIISTSALAVRSERNGFVKPIWFSVKRSNRLHCQEKFEKFISKEIASVEDTKVADRLFLITYQMKLDDAKRMNQVDSGIVQKTIQELPFGATRDEVILKYLTQTNGYISPEDGERLYQALAESTKSNIRDAGAELLIYHLEKGSYRYVTKDPEAKQSYYQKIVNQIRKKILEGENAE